MVIQNSPVVNGTEVLIRITLLNDPEKPVEIRLGFRLHEVPFVCHRPPDIPECGKPGYSVAKVLIIHVARHALVAPAIVRMKQDEVGLNAKVHQLTHPSFQMPEELGIKT